MRGLAQVEAPAALAVRGPGGREVGQHLAVLVEVDQRAVEVLVVGDVRVLEHEVRVEHGDVLPGQQQCGGPIGLLQRDLIGSRINLC